MARKVGTLHAHRLPDATSVSRYDVFRCECNKEFYMDVNPAGAANWLSLESSPHYVEYGQEEADAPRIGRWKPSDTPKEEPEQAEEETTEESVGEPDGTSEDTPEQTSTD